MHACSIPLSVVKDLCYENWPGLAAFATKLSDASGYSSWHYILVSINKAARFLSIITEECGIALGFLMICSETRFVLVFL